jgi:hypothetical protein
LQVTKESPFFFLTELQETSLKLLATLLDMTAKRLAEPGPDGVAWWTSSAVANVWFAAERLIRTKNSTGWPAKFPSKEPR